MKIEFMIFKEIPKKVLEQMFACGVASKKLKHFFLLYVIVLQ